MGSSFEESADGGEPDPDDFELVIELEDDEALPEEGPTTAASDRETIGGGGGEGPVARFRRLPRAVRVLGVAAAAAALALAVWPATGRREAVPQPVPTPTQVNIDLAKVRLGGTTLYADDGVDHAVIGLQLTNPAATRLEVVSAELWDAVGTRIGSSAVWPAQGLGARSTQSVPVTLPYSCDAYGFLPVLPLVIRYSISTPENPDVRHDYAYPLPGEVWDAYMRKRAAQCATPEAEIFASAIDTTQPIGAPSDPQGFELNFTIEAAGNSAWSVEKVTAMDPAVIDITGTSLPVVASPGTTAHVTTHWHLLNCDHSTATSGMTGVEFTARTANPPPGGGAAQQVFIAELRPGLLQEMEMMTCG